MKRTLIVLATATAVIAIGLAVWFYSSGDGGLDRPRELLDTPTQFDTPGGQEMRPRWGNKEGAGR